MINNQKIHDKVIDFIPLNSIASFTVQMSSEGKTGLKVDDRARATEKKIGRKRIRTRTTKRKTKEEDKKGGQNYEKKRKKQNENKRKRR